MLSQREAATQWGVSRITIQRAIKSGKLSLKPDKTIDPAEMFRVFGEPGRLVDRLSVPASTIPEPGRLIQLETENAMLRELLKSKDENLSDMRAQVQRLTLDVVPAQRRRRWPWSK